MDGKDKRASPAMPKAGDMVAFPRGLYSHFGIADGKGNVYHTSSDYAASGSEIKKEPLEKVATGGNFRVSNQDDKKTPLSPETILKQSEAMLGKKWPYSVVDNNCETFASEMRYGKGKGHSEQGERITKEHDEGARDFVMNQYL